ncbi:hypothetical protein GF366_04270 [Candidatus Peregrinibacteria bacterium]|nr:hypothetical protein [Candidatus Peregrinibacteria bacterium]
MQLNFFKKNLSKNEERAFTDYVNQKIDSIESLLTKFAYDARLLKASIEKFNKHDAYEVEFCLTLPNKTLVAKETSHTITKAVDLSKDRLISQIKKHLAILRKERSHKSIRHPETKEELFESYRHAEK